MIFKVRSFPVLLFKFRTHLGKKTKVLISNHLWAEYVWTDLGPWKFWPRIDWVKRKGWMFVWHRTIITRKIKWSPLLISCTHATCLMKCLGDLYVLCAMILFQYGVCFFWFHVLCDCHAHLRQIVLSFVHFDDGILLTFACTLYMKLIHADSSPSLSFLSHILLYHDRMNSMLIDGLAWLIVVLFMLAWKWFYGYNDDACLFWWYPWFYFYGCMFRR